MFDSFNIFENLSILYRDFKTKVQFNRKITLMEYDRKTSHMDPYYLFNQPDNEQDYNRDT